MAENEKILCSDSSCRFNVGGGYYGVCRHPAQLAPHYTGGIDRLYRSSCKAREPRNSNVVLMGGLRGVGRTALLKEIEEAFKEEQFYGFARGSGKSILSPLFNAEIEEENNDRTKTD